MTNPHSNLSLSSLVDISVFGLMGQGKYGNIQDIAMRFNINRKIVSSIIQRARQALLTEFILEPTANTTIQVTPALIARTIIALRVEAPASIRDIVSLLPIILGVKLSYGKIQSILKKAEQRATAVLFGIDLSSITHIAADEMFSQGKPILAGIDLNSGYLFQAEVSPDRKGETWAKSLLAMSSQGLLPDVVVKDAGTGLAKGFQLAWPGVEEHDDFFHTVYIMGKEHNRLEHIAYGKISKLEKLSKSRGKPSLSSKQRRSLGQKIRLATCLMNKAIARYDLFEEGRQKVIKVLKLTNRGSGKLRLPKKIHDVLEQVGTIMIDMKGHAKKVGRYIKNRAKGMGCYLISLSKRLHDITEQVGGSSIVEAATRAYQASLDVSGSGGPAWDKKAKKAELKAAVVHLIDVCGNHEGLKRAVGTVFPILSNRYRASSAIENFNSVLRPYLVVQKHAEQGFLNLFRFHWNTRTRQWGQHKGTSALESLTGQKVNDWLSLLGYPPEVAEKDLCLAA